MKAIVTFSEVASLQKQSINSMVHTISLAPLRQSDAAAPVRLCVPSDNVTDAAAPVRLGVLSRVCTTPRLRRQASARREAGIALLQASPCTRQRVPTLTLDTLARFVARGMTHDT